MRVMTKRQEELFDELLRLAGGDPLLLEDALREYARTGELPEKLVKAALEVQRLEQERASDKKAAG